MLETFVFAGFGGQGVMFAGQLLAYAALEEGYESTWIPSYGPEMRGGTAHCYVVISDRPIGSPIVKHPPFAIAFNNPSFMKYEPMVAPGGLLAYNESMITQDSHREDIEYLAVPAATLAERAGNMKLLNVVLLGAVLAARPVLPVEAIHRALELHLPAKHKDKLEANYRALELGVELVAARAKHKA
jgi:2-oxoglutarate ferredoxin oxidoreductase subunit gamma